MTTTSSHDGRKTMHQEIQHVRVNNPDLLAPIGEFTDNSESWGKATNGAIIVYETKTVIVDNGVPKECAAAAACKPIDSSSCSFAKINSNLFKASVLFLDSTPNLNPKYVKKIRLIIIAKGIEYK